MKNNVNITLAGNPNVGKSTVFNYLTGLKQHTGNWAGKTVSNAKGYFNYNEKSFTIIDIPGTYSLYSTSKDEEVARDFICFGESDVTIIVCDASALERNLALVIQTMEVRKNVVVCVNLLDEAIRKGIKIDFNILEEELGVPVVGTCARDGKGVDVLLQKIEKLVLKPCEKDFKLEYSKEIEHASEILIQYLKEIKPESNNLNLRWVSIKLLEKDEKIIKLIEENLGYKLFEDELFLQTFKNAIDYLQESNIKHSDIQEILTYYIYEKASSICQKAYSNKNVFQNKREEVLDKVLTSKKMGIPIMLALLAFIFWFTIVGASYPSEFLAETLFSFEPRLKSFFEFLKFSDILISVLVDGVYKVVAWVVAVMLPPMAIFFPIFTLLEDFGYLPRIAFNLDKMFKKCSSCGKQALTMAMGFGCNAAAVTGCRIIDSPRERLIAILTNNFVPCNGRLPFFTK